MDKIMVDIREESKQIRRIFEGLDLVSVEDLLTKIEDLDDSVSDLEDKIEELESDIEENYQPKKIDPYDYYGVSERDFH